MSDETKIGNVAVCSMCGSLLINAQCPNYCKNHGSLRLMDYITYVRKEVFIESDWKIITDERPHLSNSWLDKEVTMPRNQVLDEMDKQAMRKIDQHIAKQAVVTLLHYIGEDPNREGLLETPDRVIRSFSEFFSGYNEDPDAVLSKTFEEVNGYDGLVILKNIRVESHCEHHMVPFIGTAHIGYLPNNRVVGISKLARVLEVFSKRLQIQEKLTQQVANCIMENLQPKGVGVILECQHECMTTRGVNKNGVSMVTSSMLGCFREDESIKDEFLRLINI